MSDAEIIRRLKNLATDAVMSGDDEKGRLFGQAAARLTELSVIHHTWHPCISDIIGKEAQ